MDKNIFSERLHELQGDMKDIEFSKLCGIPNATMGMYKKGSLPSIEKASAIAEAFNVSLDWLCGKDTEVTVYPDDLVIAHYDIEAHAGDGSMEMIADIKNYISFDPSWFKRYVPASAILGAIDVNGDSMQPTLNPGDMIIVNMNREHIKGALAEGGVFVLAVRGDFKVKRLQPKVDGSLRMISDNPRYEPEVITSDMLAEDVHIQGHVIWVGGPPK